LLVCGGHSATGVGTLLQHTKGKSAGWLTIVSSPADLGCPSWARAEGGLLGPTRTLLIQSLPAQAGVSDNLLGNGYLPSIGARSPCRSLPAFARRNYGETTATQSQLPAPETLFLPGRYHRSVGPARALMRDSRESAPPQICPSLGGSAFIRSRVRQPQPAGGALRHTGVRHLPRVSGPSAC
jgi:hypothetical protein